MFNIYDPLRNNKYCLFTTVHGTQKGIVNFLLIKKLKRLNISQMCFI